jgi:hypothetical protein
MDHIKIYCYQKLGLLKTLKVIKITIPYAIFIWNHGLENFGKSILIVDFGKWFL